MRVDVRMAAAGADEWELTADYTDASGAAVRLGPHRVGRTERAPWVAPAGGALPDPTAEIEDVVARIREQDHVEEDDGKCLGRFLYDSVLGLVWPDIREAANGAGARLLELALHFPPEHSKLHGVPWELAHDGTRHLTTDGSLAVAMTRRIQAPGVGRQIDAPAKVLFAIGTDLQNEEVRAGAEFLGLMRELERQGDSIVPLVVDEASVRRLEESVERFRPHVVHLISHGQSDDEGGYLLMQSPEEDEEGSVLVDGQTLGAALESRDGLPAIVVLSACEGGTARAAHSVPLAVELLERGVPIVVAMSGKVSDRACRLFTRRFGSVLVQGAPLVQAAADGRWAAFRDGEPPSRSVDWALPVVFLADDIPHDFEPVKHGVGTPLGERMRSYKLPAKTVFCGRRAFLRAYDDLVSARSPLATLIVYTEGQQHGVGKTRLLREFAAQALRDGHLPCMHPLFGLPGTRPTDLAALAEHLLVSIVETRKRCRLPMVTQSMLLDMLTPEDVASDLSVHPEEERATRLHTLLTRHRESKKPPIAAQMVKEAATVDFERLRKAAIESGEPAYGEWTRVVLLLDGVEHWGVLPDALFGTMLVGPEGLGPTAEVPVPVVAACVRDVLHDQLFPELEERTRVDDSLLLMKLAPLEVGLEDSLAFQWVLLNPDRAVSRQVYAVPDHRADWQTPFRTQTGGLPSKLGTSEFFGLAKWIAANSPLLASGDDDDVLETTLKLTGAGGPHGGGP